MVISKNVAPMKLIEESIVDFMDFDSENEENEEADEDKEIFL